MIKQTQLKRLPVVLALLACSTLPGVVPGAEQQPSVDRLQRLFTTAYERAQLDALRRRGKQDHKLEEKKNRPVLPPAEVVVKGLVKRKDSANVVWINDKNTLKSEKVDERTRVKTSRVSEDNRIPIVVDGRSVNLKPGQAWNEIDRRVRDSYQIKHADKLPAGVDAEVRPQDNQ